MRRFKGILLNLSLIPASILLLYLVFEFVLSPLALIHFPHRLQWRVSAPLLVFTRSSRSHRIPEDYILIVGDSHAVGIISDDKGFRKWTTHSRASDAVLFERTGRDVIAFGQGGAGSLGGLVATPISTYEFFSRTLLYRMPPPRIILAYFYEGNDLDDNIRELRQRYDGKFAPERFYEPAYFQSFIDDVVLKEHVLYRRAEGFRWYDNLLFADFLRAFLQKTWKRLHTHYPKPASAGTHETVERINKAVVDGRTVLIPDKLQSPSLELRPGEIGRAVYVFEQSLRRLKSRFPESAVFVVYIPSPLSCYELASDRVSIERYHDRKELHPASEVRARSDLIEKRIREASERAGCPLIDTRGPVRERAARVLVHGPLDWYHFNRPGYEAMTEAVLPRIRKALDR